MSKGSTYYISGYLFNCCGKIAELEIEVEIRLVEEAKPLGTFDLLSAKQDMSTPRSHDEFIQLIFLYGRIKIKLL